MCGCGGGCGGCGGCSCGWRRRCHCSPDGGVAAAVILVIIVLVFFFAVFEREPSHYRMPHDRYDHYR